MNIPNFDENEVLRDALSGLNEDAPPMPEELHAAWMQKVEEDQMEKKMSRKGIARFLSIAAALVFVVGGTLLTRDNMEHRARYDSYSADNGAMQMRAMTADEYIEPYEDYAFTFGAAPEAAPAAGRTITLNAKRAASTASQADTAAAMQAEADKKIIRTASLTVYTQTYDNSLDSLRALCEAEGGWIESSSESTNSRTNLRTAHLTLRIPQSALDGYLAGAEQLGRITSRSETAEDVTASYQDMQTRLDTQLALMDRLQALITESGDLSDLLALEAQIADTQYQIDSLTTSLRRTDRQVSYSTVNVSLYEEVAPALTDTTVSLGERITSALYLGCEALADFAQDMLVFLIAALPFIGIVAAVVIVVIVIRKIRRRNRV